MTRLDVYRDNPLIRSPLIPTSIHPGPSKLLVASPPTTSRSCWRLLDAWHLGKVSLNLHKNGGRRTLWKWQTKRLFVGRCFFFWLPCLKTNVTRVTSPFFNRRYIGSNGWNLSFSWCFFCRNSLPSVSERKWFIRTKHWFEGAKVLLALGRVKDF